MDRALERGCLREHQQPCVERIETAGRRDRASWRSLELGAGTHHAIGSADQRHEPFAGHWLRTKAIARSSGFRQLTHEAGHVHDAALMLLRRLGSATPQLLHRGLVGQARAAIQGRVTHQPVRLQAGEDLQHGAGIEAQRPCSGEDLLDGRVAVAVLQDRQDRARIAAHGDRPTRTVERELTLADRAAKAEDERSSDGHARILQRVATRRTSALPWLASAT
jgi:hypothetical protein